MKHIYRCTLDHFGLSLGTKQFRIDDLRLHGVMITAGHPNIATGEYFISSAIEMIDFKNHVVWTKNSIYVWE